MTKNNIKTSNRVSGEAIEGEVIESNTRTRNDDNVKSSKKQAPLKMPLKHRKFVQYYSEGETMGNGTKSAIKAGYSEASAHVQASRLLRNEKVLAVLNSNVEAAEMTISNIMTTGESDAVRLAAARELLDRTIGKPIQRSVSVHANVTVESMLGED